jgi:hypothetical protein
MPTHHHDRSWSRASISSTPSASPFQLPAAVPRLLPLPSRLDLLSLLLWLLAYYIMSVAGTVAFHRFPRVAAASPVPLPDVIFDFVLKEPYVQPEPLPEAHQSER